MSRNGQLPDGNLEDRGYCQRLHNPESFRGIRLNHFPWPLLLSIWRMKPEMNVAWVRGPDKKCPRPLTSLINFTVHPQVLCGYCILCSLLVCQRKFMLPLLGDMKGLRSHHALTNSGVDFLSYFEKSIKTSCFSFVFLSFLSWLILWASLSD